MKSTKTNSFPHQKNRPTSSHFGSPGNFFPLSTVTRTSVDKPPKQIFCLILGIYLPPTTTTKKKNKRRKEEQPLPGVERAAPRDKKVPSRVIFIRPELNRYRAALPLLRRERHFASRAKHPFLLIPCSARAGFTRLAEMKTNWGRAEKGRGASRERLHYCPFHCSPAQSPFFSRPLFFFFFLSVFFLLPSAGFGLLGFALRRGFGVLFSQRVRSIWFRARAPVFAGKRLAFRRVKRSRRRKKSGTVYACVCMRGLTRKKRDCWRG